MRLIADEIDAKSAQKLFLEKRYEYFDENLIEWPIYSDDKRIKEFYMYSLMGIHLNNAKDCLKTLEGINSWGEAKRSLFSDDELRDLKFGLYQSAILQYMKCLSAYTIATLCYYTYLYVV